MIIKKILGNNPIWIEVNNQVQFVFIERFMGNYEQIEEKRQFPLYINYNKVKMPFGFVYKIIDTNHPGSDQVTISFKSFNWLIDDEAALSVLYGDLSY